MNNWILLLVKQILTLISPQLRAALVEFIAKLEKDAKATANPWDDIVVGILKYVLLIK